MPASADGQIADAPVAWDCEVDLLIAGAGPAGMTAALVASIEGLSVMLCEKSSQVGGTAATSAGTLWIPGNRQGGGAADEAAGDYLDALVGNRAGGDIRKAYLERGPRVIDYMVESGEIAFLPCGVHPDYRSELPGAAVEGRAIVPAPFDGRLLGRDFARVRPPIGEFMVFGGMMVGKQDIPNLLNRFRSLDNFSYSAKLFARYLRDRLRHARGTRLVMGNALVAQLFYRLRRRAVDIRFDAPLVDLITGKGVVEGAVLSVEGRHMRVRARRGVILATGGIAYNQALREATMPTPSPFSMACETDTGDGIEAGMRVGAALGGKDHITSAVWTPVSVTPAAQGR
ncbi:MAG: FAD-binding protein [Sphingomonadaceae bacterium]